MGSDASAAKGVALAHLSDVSRRLWQRQLVGSYLGGCAIRQGKNLWVRGSGTSNATLKPSDVTSLSPGIWPGAALLFHALKARADAKAAILMAPPATSALAIANEVPADTLWAHSASILGSIGFVECALLEDENELAIVSAALEDSKTLLLSHVGALVVGRDLEDAYHRAEVLELTATTLIRVRQIGSERPLNQNAFDHYLQHGLSADLTETPSMAMLEKGDPV